MFGGLLAQLANAALKGEGYARCKEVTPVFRKGRTGVYSD
jgi:hypothetical protein